MTMRNFSERPREEQDRGTVASQYDPLTERILTEISRKRLFKATVAELIGMTPQTFYTRCRRGDWRTSEVAALAAVLQTSFERLTEVA
jgi:hypothetical protein